MQLFAKGAYGNSFPIRCHDCKGSDWISVGPEEVVCSNPSCRTKIENYKAVIAQLQGRILELRDWEPVQH